MTPGHRPAVDRRVDRASRSRLAGPLVLLVLGMVGLGIPAAATIPPGDLG